MRPSDARRTVALLVATLAGLLVRAPHVVAQTPGLVLPGVVVETVDIGSAPYRAGIRSGDVLIGWARVGSSPGDRPVRGKFTSPFDLKPFELEEVPRGAHNLFIERGGARLRLRNSPGPWTDMTVRSNLAGEALNDYGRGLQQVGQTYPGGLDVFTAALIDGQLRVAGERVKRQDFDAGLRSWELLASHLSGVGEHAAAAWLRWRVTWELINFKSGKNSRLPEAEPMLETAVTAVQALKCSVCEADLYNRFAHELVRTSQLETARAAAFERAIAATERALPESPTLAAVLQEYAMVGAGARGNNIEDRHRASHPFYRRAIALRARLTPRSPERALLLAEFAGSLVPGDLDGARFCREAWRLVRQVAPLTSEAMSVGDHCMHYFSFHGDLAAMETMSRHAAAAVERWLPRSREVTRLLSSFAEVLTARGKLAEAEAAAQKALDQCRRIEREWAAAGWKGTLVDSVWPLTALGDIAYARGDLAIAEDWYRQAIAAMQRLAPEHLGDGAMGLARVFEARGDVGRASDVYARLGKELSNGSVPAVTSLARLSLRRGDLPRAEAEARRALSYTGPHMQGSLEHADVLEALARIASARGDFDEAAARHADALAILHTQASGTLGESRVLHSLGELQHRRGALSEAEVMLARALEIRVRLAPGTSIEAETRHGLALVHRAMRHPDTDSDFRLALRALEQQVGRAGSGDQARAGTAARNAAIYRDYMDWLLDNGRPAEAFHVLERSRARSFLASLAERQVRFDRDTPPALAAERARTEVEYDQLQGMIAAADPTRERERLSGLLVRLHALQASLNAVAERIRASAPKVAAIRYPVPLTATQIGTALDPGTAVLSYAVGQNATRLFVLPASGEQGIRVITIAASEDGLRRDVDAFRQLIAWKRASDDKALMARGSALYDALVRPAEAHIGSAQRLLIVGDGPLLTLPFCALIRSIREGTLEYLIGWKPVHSALSVTSYAELRKTRRPRSSGPGSVVAFGDPIYPAMKHVASSDTSRASNGEPATESFTEPAPSRWDDWGPSDRIGEGVTDAEVLVETDRGARLTPLPASRREVLAVARLYGASARIYLGHDATEARATALDRSARIVHFAAHGLVNDVLPLNSALALSIPAAPRAGSDNGLLQAWEIYDRMHLDADLVTLSACETALGRETRGEGLFGLTRAFLYAGARSVLASLWRISDNSTAVLMEHFYRELRSGRPKDEALRSAQLSLLGSKDTAHPYHWAAFELHGDWK